MPRQLQGRPLRSNTVMGARVNPAARYTPSSLRVQTATGADKASTSKLLDGPRPRTPIEDTPFSMDWMGLADSTIPFLSNVLNTFRKVPAPMAPVKVSPVPTARVVLDKSPVMRATAVARKVASQLDGPQATAFGAAALDSQIQGLNDLASRQAELDAEIAGRNNQTQLQADMFNAQNENQFKDELVGAQIAQQNQRAGNLANAADKYVAIRNTGAMRKLDADRLTTYSKLFNQGMYERLIGGLKAQGVNVPGEFAFGGELPEGATQGTSKAGNTALDNTVHVRDYVSSLVGGGYTSYDGEEARGLASNLKNSLGSMSNDMLLHISMFNSRPDMVRLSPEERIAKFYELGSNNTALAEYLNKMKNVGYGPREGFRTSPNVIARKLNGTPIYAKS